MITAYIGLGSNLGDSIAILKQASLDLGGLPGSRLLRRSRLYRTAPWGDFNQPDFVNAVVEIATDLTAMELLSGLLALESAAGRQRNGDRWGPRLLDLDVLLYGDQYVDEPGLHVPHPRLAERAFALVPLAELAPQLVVPGQGCVQMLLARIDASSVRAIGPLA